jgi:hypothetical protein
LRGNLIHSGKRCCCVLQTPGQPLDAAAAVAATAELLASWAEEAAAEAVAEEAPAFGRHQNLTMVVSTLEMCKAWLASQPGNLTCQRQRWGTHEVITC